MIIFIPNKGRCVIADQNYYTDEIVEETNVILIPKENLKQLDSTILEKYYFEWFDGDGAILTGNGLLYNHWTDPNLKLIADQEKLKMKFVAKRNIIKGEEFTFDYGYFVPDIIGPTFIL